MAKRKTNIGRLNQRITIQTATLTPDGQGGNTEVWADTVTVWAEALPKGSSRQIDRQQMIITADVTFRIRSNNNIAKDNRVTYEGRTLTVHGIRDWEQDREFTFIDCTYENE